MTKTLPKSAAGHAQGIPVAFPGSLLTTEILKHLSDTLAAGGTVTGATDPSCAKLYVLEDLRDGVTLHSGSPWGDATL